MKGCIPKAWSVQIDSHFQEYGMLSHKTNGAQWSKKLCSFIFRETHHAWCRRSSMVDEAAQTSHQRQERQRLHHEIQDLYKLKPVCALQYPFSISLDRRLLLNNDHLSAWLSNHKANILRGHTKWKLDQLNQPRQLDIRSFFPVIRRTQ